MHDENLNIVENGSKRKHLPRWLIVISVLFLVVRVIFFALGYPHADRVFKEEFASALEQKREEVYSNFYDKGFEVGEERYHTKNSETTSINNIKEVAVLEVLTVSASDVKEYRIDN